MSIVGLASKTGPIIIGLVITLDFSKVIIASVLYKNWHNLNWALRTIFLPVCVVLVVVTSAGAYAFILKEFGNLTNDSEKEKIVLQLNQEEKEKLEARKKSLEEQVAQLPANYVRQRANLMNTFKPELDSINERLDVINTEIKTAKTSRFDTNKEGSTSTIGSLAQVYNIPPDQVNRILALFITIMIDPLAIALLTLANFLSSLRKRQIEEHKIKEYVKKTRAEKINDLIFGKNIPIQYPEVNVSFQDISNSEISKENMKIYHFIKSFQLVDPTIITTGENKLSTNNILQDRDKEENNIEKLNIIPFINECKLKETETSLFEEPLISFSSLAQFKMFSQQASNKNITDLPVSIEDPANILTKPEEIINKTNILSSSDETIIDNNNLFDTVIETSINTDQYQDEENNIERLDIIVDHLNPSEEKHLDMILDAEQFLTLTETLETSNIVEDSDDTGFDLSYLKDNSSIFEEIQPIKEDTIRLATEQQNIDDFNNIKHLWIDDPAVRKVYEKEQDTKF